MIGPILRNLLQNADFKLQNYQFNNNIIPPFVRTRVYSEIYSTLFSETSFENISVVYERGGRGQAVPVRGEGEHLCREGAHAFFVVPSTLCPR